ncbi:hypothetical protein FQZ97_872250 [compost metagenome]
MAAAEVGIPAQLRGGRPVHAEFRGELLPVLVQVLAAETGTCIAARIAPFEFADQGPVRRQVPVQPGQQVEVARRQVVIAEALQALAVLRAVGVQLATHVAVRPPCPEAVVQHPPGALELPLRAQGVAVGQGVAERIGEVVDRVLRIDAEYLAQRLASPLGTVGETQLLGIAVRVAAIDVQQAILRGVAVAQDTAWVVLQAILGDHVGNLERQVAP